MRLADLDKRYVCVRTVYGDTVTGLARYEDREYLESEWGGRGDGLFIGDCLIYASQIASAEEIEPHGTVELWTERLILRPFTPEDAEPLFRSLGADPAAGDPERGPYATPEAARETVRGILDGCGDGHFYAWIMDMEDVPVGTIEARGLTGDRIGVCLRVDPDWRGRGLGAEALRKVLGYLTENEGIPRVTARCGAGDAGAREALEAAGMRPVPAEGDGPASGEGDRGEAVYEYRRGI